MNTDTGEMISVEDLKKLPIQEQKKFTYIPDSLSHEIEGMNRKQRRQWYKDNKKRIGVINESA